jgi:Do/DeqQ family serine protease
MNTRRTLSPRAYLGTAAAFLVVGIAMGLALSGSFSGERMFTPGGTPVVNAAAPMPAGGSLESPFVTVVERSLPAVVLIESRRAATQRDTDDDEMDLFRRMFPDRGRRPEGAPSSGSGFLIDRSGRILTNNHVVTDAKTIKVTLADKRTFEARVVGQDPATDVAVIQIQGAGSSFPTLPLGDSDGIRVGDWAIAIGNPLGELQGSVTAGIISAKGRSSLNIMGGGPDYQDFIQTDASINFGNSGGPLMNIRGEVIGINTAINAAGQGIGFAIPINLARRVAEQLVSGGKVVRGYIGVLPGELSPDLAESFGLSSTEGVVISQVVPNSPAANAGLREGDIVTSFDNKKVRDVTDFRLKVADAAVEHRVPVEILRDGRPRTVHVTLANRESSLAAQQGETPSDEGRSGGSGSGGDRLLGIDVRMPNDDEAADFDNERGVVVQDVAGGSPADGRIQPGEMILQVNGQPVRNVREFGTAVKSGESGGRPIRLLVGSPTRNGLVTRFVAVRPESR